MVDPTSTEFGTTWLADIIAYTFMLLEERWRIVCMGKGHDKGYLLVAGPLSGGELSDLAKRFFPQSLSHLGIPGPGFRRSMTVARGMSEQFRKTYEQVEPTVISGTENTQREQTNEGASSHDTQSGCPTPQISPVPPPTLVTASTPSRLFRIITLITGCLATSTT